VLNTGTSPNRCICKTAHCPKLQSAGHVQLPAAEPHSRALRHTLTPIAYLATKFCVTHFQALTNALNIAHEHLESCMASLRDRDSSLYTIGSQDIDTPTLDTDESLRCKHSFMPRVGGNLRSNLRVSVHHPRMRRRPRSRRTKRMKKTRFPSSDWMLRAQTRTRMRRTHHPLAVLL